MNKVRDKEYLQSAKDYPCVFCGIMDETIVGHHVRDHTGMGQKPSDAAIVSACHTCHADCHNGTISKMEQKKAWYEYAAMRLEVAHGSSEAFNRMVMAFWSVL